MKIHGPEQEGRNTAKVNDDGQLLVTQVSDSVNNTDVVLATDYLTAVSLRLIPGVTHASLAAEVDDVDTGDPPITVWSGPGLYPWQAAAYSLEVLSSDANDTSAGSGMQTLVVIGLDENWLEQIEVVSMNGVTPVAVPGQWLRINRMVGATAGATLTNEGVITAQVASGGDVQAIILPEKSLAAQAVYTVPDGKSALFLSSLNDIIKGSGSGTQAEIGIYTRANDIVGRPFIQGIDQGLSSTGTSAIIQPVPVATLLPPKTDIEIRVLSVGSNGTSVGSAFSVILYDNSIL